MADQPALQGCKLSSMQTCSSSLGLFDSQASVWWDEGKYEGVLTSRFNKLIQKTGAVVGVVKYFYLDCDPSLSAQRQDYNTVMTWF